GHGAPPAIPVTASASNRVPDRRARWISVKPVRSGSGSPGRRGVTANGGAGEVRSVDVMVPTVAGRGSSRLAAGLERGPRPASPAGGGDGGDGGPVRAGSGLSTVLRGCGGS